MDLTNSRLIPTILEKAQQTNIVPPDLLTLEGAEVVAAGWVTDKHRPGPTEIIDQNELDRIIIRSGHPGRTTKTIEYLVRGSGTMTVQYAALKGGTVSTEIELR